MTRPSDALERQDKKAGTGQFLTTPFSPLDLPRLLRGLDS
jgi:hypothetical protein